jgi:hypothetical protein
MKESKQQPDRRRVVCLPFIFFNLCGAIVDVVAISRQSELAGVHSRRDEREGVVPKADDVHDVAREPKAVARPKSVVGLSGNDDPEIARKIFQSGRRTAPFVVEKVFKGRGRCVAMSQRGG